MRLNDLLLTICSSDSELWNSIEPPYELKVTYLDTSEDSAKAETFGYYSKWVYSDNVRISVAISEEIERHGRDYETDWNVWPDRGINEHFLDIFLDGQVVYREKVLCVDGGRVFLPCPKMETVDTGQMWHEPFTNSVTERQYELVRFLADVRSDREFSEYFKQSGFIVLPEI